MAAEHLCFGLLVTSLLCSLAVLALQDDTLVKAQQAATESYKSEDIVKNYKAQMPVTAEKQGHQTDSCASQTAGEETANEICGEDLRQSKLDTEDKITSSSYQQCEADQLLRCPEEKAENLGENTAPEGLGVENLEQISEPVKDAEFSGNIIQRSMQGLEDMLGQVEKSGVKVFEKLGGVMDQVGLSGEHMLKRLDTVMGRVSESVSESKVRVIQGLDSLMDQVSASSSKMMEEIDHVIDTVAHSKVIEEIRALPREIRESFVLSVRNRSYVAAGVMVAIATAILVAGAVYFAWCHQDTWSHHTVLLESLTDYKDEDLFISKDKNGVISENKDVVNSKDKDDVNCKDKDYINSKDTDNVQFKDKVDVNPKDNYDVNSKDKDDINSKDKYDVNSKDKDDANTKDSMNSEAAVKRGFPAQGLKSISNHHTAAVGFDEHPENDNTNPTGDDSCQRTSGSLGTEGFGGKGTVSDVELQQVSVKGSDVSHGLVSSYSEEAARSEIKVTQDDGDVHEGQVRDITKGDIALEYQQKGMPSRGELQNSMTSKGEQIKDVPVKCEHQRSMPFTDEHQSVLNREPLLSKDKSHASTCVDKSLTFESSSDAGIGWVKSENCQIQGSFSGLDSDDAVQESQSDTVPLNNSSTYGLRSVSCFTEVTGNSLEKGYSKNKNQQSTTVSANRAENYSIVREGTINHQESVSMENRE